MKNDALWERLRVRVFMELGQALPGVRLEDLTIVWSGDGALLLWYQGQSASITPAIIQDVEDSRETGTLSDRLRLDRATLDLSPWLAAQIVRKLIHDPQHAERDV